MSARKCVSEEGLNRILEKIARTILEKAETVEEAAQIAREAKYAREMEANVVTKCSINPAGSRLLEATINVPGVSPESVINAMEMLHSTLKEYIICFNEKGSRKFRSAAIRTKMKLWLPGGLQRNPLSEKGNPSE